MRSVGCVSVILAACCGCCALRLPTFGLGSTADEDVLLTALQKAPLVVDKVCAPDRRCDVVEHATMDAVPVGWAPLSGEWTYLVSVEATCTELPPGGAAGPERRGSPHVCTGLIAAIVGARVGGGVGAEVVRDTVIPTRTYPARDGGGGWDWD